MPLTPSTLLGPYEILAPLGAGGMGEVYRARDTRLGRVVALKRLPDAFAHDPERVARFEREARLLASLNHPNIAALYGVEKTDGALCLALELIEGESLAQRLTRGALPADEAFDVAAQVAAALEAAHDAGVVHRDLKPANVMLRPDGVVKVLDFGLARGPADATAGASGAHVDLTQSPTMTSPATVPGVILGTAAYMSPEQAKGRVATRRSDLWAWGCLLYELLSGRRAFEGEDVSETMASILRSEPDWSALPADTPPGVRELLGLCLRKDARQRLGDAGDARLLLAESRAHVVPSMSATPRGRGWSRGTAAIALAAVALVAVGATVLVQQFRTSAAPGLGSEIVRTELSPPDGITTSEGIFHFAVISPDGRNVVFTGRRAGGRRMLWVRPLDTVTARALPGTEDAIVPFWSPDGRSVAFGSDGKLRRVDLAGGQPQVLADAARLVAGTWGSGGDILYCPDYRAGLYRIPATGGTPVLEMPGDSLALQAPRFLPDGRHYLFVKAGGSATLSVASLGSTNSRPLLSDVTNAIYAPPGFLIYIVRGTLQARRFDARSMRFSGEAIPISTGFPNEEAFAGRVSVSANGVMLLQKPQAHDVQLTWFDRAGHRLATVGPPRQTTTYEEFALSPDGRRVALKRTSSRGQPDIWLIDVTNGSQSRLTTDPGQDQLPVWSPDGRFIYTSSNRQAGSGIHRIAVDGSGEQLLLRGAMYPHDITPDGRFLIYLNRGEATRMDIWGLPLGEGAQPIPLLTSEFEEREPRVSPDGRWLAYTSDLAGYTEIYVRSLAEGRLGEAVRVSQGGGVGARWSPDGRELYFIAAATDGYEGTLKAVRVHAGEATLVFEDPVPLFPVRVARTSLSANYDIDRSGRILVDQVVGETPSHPTLILNWMSELNRKR